jgi:DNA polymerase I-like protein with 3'-5' exonuclease and polymerase domains
VESILKTFFIKQRDYKKVLKEKFECETLFIQENEDNSVALDIFKSIDNPIVACDIETTGLFFLSESILSISFAFLVKDKKYTLAIDAESMHDPDVEAMIRKVLCSNKFVKVFHNATFDMKFLSRDGFKVSAPIADTKLIAHLYNENTPKSLLYLTKQHLPEIL